MWVSPPTYLSLLSPGLGNIFPPKLQRNFIFPEDKESSKIPEPENPLE
jgi:hypothetical protein